jgi:hypothetical protein
MIIRQGFLFSFRNPDNISFFYSKNNAIFAPQFKNSFIIINY